MKQRRRKPRIGKSREVPPSDVPEVSAQPSRPQAEPEPDPIPESIRRMLEAAYT